MIHVKAKGPLPLGGGRMGPHSIGCKYYITEYNQTSKLNKKHSKYNFLLYIYLEHYMFGGLKKMAIPLRTSMTQSVYALKKVYNNEPVTFAGGIRLNTYSYKE